MAVEAQAMRLATMKMNDRANEILSGFKVNFIKLLHLFVFNKFTLNRFAI